MLSITTLRVAVVAGLIMSGATAMAQTAGQTPSPSAPGTESTPSPAPASDAMGMSRPQGPGRYQPGHHHAQRHERGMMGGVHGHDRMEGSGRMMGGHMMGHPTMGGNMMGGCPLAATLPPGNEKLAMRMHGEMMVAIGNILIKNADNIQSKPSN